MAKENKTSIAKIILIFFIVFVIVPIGIMALIYFNNINFKNKTNDYFKKMPGAIGAHFNNYPTKTETNEKKVYLANYYISMDVKTAADKVYIIKKNDEELYTQVVKLMNSISPTKTREIIGLVRDIEIKKNLLFTLYDEIKEEEENALVSEAKRLEKLDLIIALGEINQNIKNSKNQINELGNIMNEINEDKLGDILYYLDEEIRNALLNKLDDNKKRNVCSALNRKRIENERIADLANIYEYRDPLKSVKEIGNTSRYNIEQLSKIYRNLSIKTASSVLLNVEDDEFKDELFNAIKKEEMLNNEKESMVEKINETIKYINSYEDKINQLVILYEKMNSENIAKIIEKMMYSYNQVSSLEIDSIPIYKISDATIIEDVLRKMNKTKLSKILSQMDSRKAAEITRRLAIP